MASRLTGCKVLLGVCGGIAAYKAADLAGKLAGAGATVQTILTASACELITPKTFEALTGQPVYTSLWTGSEDFRIGHIRLADWARIIVVAPATANLLAKLAGGLCDDLLSTTLCAAWQKPLVLVPAMNTNMWSNPAVQRNVKAVEQMGATLVGPKTGRLACGTEGLGRMAEPAEILQAVETVLA
ncbi:MAG: phosphopantothenoylcysteine decarboxylase [Sedimentisphaerales bacterium]|nr:phosphopantothenoylcysteine decarboxylase [Sedimentisphaerales bacterium]